MYIYICSFSFLGFLDTLRQTNTAIFKMLHRERAGSSFSCSRTVWFLVSTIAPLAKSTCLVQPLLAGSNQCKKKYFNSGSSSSQRLDSHVCVCNFHATTSMHMFSMWTERHRWLQPIAAATQLPPFSWPPAVRFPWFLCAMVMPCHPVVQGSWASTP